MEKVSSLTLFRAFELFSDPLIKSSIYLPKDQNIWSQNSQTCTKHDIVRFSFNHRRHFLRIINRIIVVRFSE